MHTDNSVKPTFGSLFDIRHNWRHLTTRASFQEPVIDGVRAIAILWVVTMHFVFFHLQLFPKEGLAIFTNLATAWLMRGDLGVDLFFVISGYLMGTMLFGEFKKTGDLQFSRFYVRRFLRLIPVYIAAMTLALYLDPLNAGNFWANIIYVNNFLSLTKQYMGWCWSLAIEEQFYILLPACILLFMGLGKGRIRILVGMMMLSVIIRYAVIHFSHVSLPVPPVYTPQWFYWFDVEYDKLWMRYGGLLAGVTGAYLSCYFMPQLKTFFARRGLITALSIGCLLLIAHISSTSLQTDIFNRIPVLVKELWFTFQRDLFSLSAMFLILAAIHTPSLFGGSLRRFLSWKGFYPIAQLSYSLYLVQEMLFVWLFPRVAPLFVARLGNYGTMAVDSAIGLVLALAITTVFYLTIERPCMRMRTHTAVLGAIEFLKGPKLRPAA